CARERADYLNSLDVW
nr:immunoglobulin heavy chain junction region [Macaca mulatta]MOX95085.1 immunoglobulin heavy chain junction region [Macaca mulatta]